MAAPSRAQTYGGDDGDGVEQRSGIAPFIVVVRGGAQLAPRDVPAADVVDVVDVSLMTSKTY